MGMARGLAVCGTLLVLGAPACGSTGDDDGASDAGELDPDATAAHDASSKPDRDARAADDAGRRTTDAGDASRADASDAGSEDAGSEDAGSEDASDQDGGDASPACPGAVELCDGVLDDDCDGVVDNGCGRCPLMEEACAGGCCAVDRVHVADYRALPAHSIAVDARGNVFYAHGSRSPSPAGVPGACLAIYDAVAGSWRLQDFGLTSDRNRVLVDGLGRVHFVYGSYVQAQGNNGSLWYVRSDDAGQTFSAPVAVASLAIGGVFDLELDGQNQPHLAWEGTFVGTQVMFYGRFDGATWSTERIDEDGISNHDDADLELDADGRPRIVTTTYDTKRVLQKGADGTWSAEIAYQQANVNWPENQFNEHTYVIRPDGTSELLFSLRANENVPWRLFLAKRPAGAAQAWQSTEITTVSSFQQATLFFDGNGRRAAVSDGVALHRQDAAGTWATTLLGVPGVHVAQARRGRYLYLGYSDPSANDRPTVKVVDLGP